MKRLNDVATGGYAKTVIDSCNVVRYHYTSIDSTMLEGRRIAPYITPENWYLCTSDEQTSGIGQHERVWTSPLGVNVYATFGFASSEKDFKKLLCIPHIAGLSIIQTLENFGIVAKLKWVNDTLVDGRKISGVLVERPGDKVTDVNKIDHYVYLVGIGINVNLDKANLFQISQPATSMFHCTGHILAVNDVVLKLTSVLYNNINVLLKEGFIVLKQLITPKLEDFKGQPTIFDSEDYENSYIVGKIKGLCSEYGQLIFEEDSGTIHKFANGRILRGQDIKKPLEVDAVLNKLIKLHHFDYLDSTQLYAKNHLDLTSDKFWHAIVADYQTSGAIDSTDRKSLLTKQESVFCTYMLPYYGELTREQLSQLVALSTQETLMDFHCNAKIKYLNDVVSKGKEISSNLVEIIEPSDGPKLCLISVRLNVNQSEERLSQLGLSLATSMKLSMKSEGDISVPTIYSSLTRKIYYNFQIAIGFGYEKIREKILLALDHINHKIGVFDKDTAQDYCGIFKTIEDNGAMLLSSTDGATVTKIINGYITNDYGVFDQAHEASTLGNNSET